MNRVHGRYILNAKKKSRNASAIFGAVGTRRE